jgi:hypothetical protein
MQVKIKDFDVAPMEVRNNGIEFEVRSPNGNKQIGDLVLTKTKLEWCEGRTHRGNGVTKTWQEFIDWMNS